MMDILFGFHLNDVTGITAITASPIHDPSLWDNFPIGCSRKPLIKTGSVHEFVLFFDYP
ncbi:hypothetical protein Hdeb2414_s0010g00328581 [Helianthus debilis subsp. tardiflorus]